MISRDDGDSAPHEIAVTVPVEVWTCEVSASFNPNAESEAMVVESAISAGSLGVWSKAYRESPPLRTLSSIVNSGLLLVSESGEVLPSEEIAEAIEEGTLVDILKKTGSGRTETRVVRDLLTGSFHHPRVLYGSAELSESVGM